MSLANSLAAVSGADLSRAASAIMQGAADMTLLIDGSGFVRGASAGERVGPVDAASIEGRPVGALFERRDLAALEALITAAPSGGNGAVSLRHLPPAPTAAPMRYTALGRPDGAVLLVGRLSARLPVAPADPAALVADRGDQRRRATEARYRMLFETAAEAVVVVSLDTGRVEEANARALAALDTANAAGRPLAALFDEADAAHVERQLAMARAGGEFAPLVARLVGSGRAVAIEGRAFRAFDRTQLMLRVAKPGSGGADRRSPAIALVARLMRESRNALALTDRVGRLVWTNAAFDALAGAVEGRSLAELTEFSASALDAILGGARERGRISLADARLRLDPRRPAQGRLTVIALPDECGAGFGLVFRPADEPAAEEEPPQTPAEIGIGIGADGGATLKDLLRDATDEIERSCIEAALRLTGGNRAAAAKALGLSRQSLYVKMRRFGLV